MPEKLADGAIAKLTVLQLNDERSLQAIANILRNYPSKPDTWKLTLYIQKDWIFVVTPEVKGSHRAHSLFLHVHEVSR